MARPYNPIRIQGIDNPDCQRSSDGRYEVVRRIASRWGRRFSAFDFGANLGYFSVRLAEDFDCVPILVDRQSRLREVLNRNHTPAIWLNCHLSGSELMRLAACERFDLGLALNVLHHLADWREALAGMQEMCRRLIVETPETRDETAKNPHLHEPILEAVLLGGGMELARFDSHTSRPRRMFLLESPSLSRIERQTIDAESRGAPPCDVSILLDDDRAEVVIRHLVGAERRSFIAGMNLWNFRLLSGAWPDGDALYRRALRVGHDDPMPWNYILDGRAVHPIDRGNRRKPRRQLDGIQAWKTGVGRRSS